MTEQQTLSRETAIAFAADALLDAFEEAKQAHNIDAMINISKIWLEMSDRLVSLDQVEESQEEVGHYL